MSLRYLDFDYSEDTEGVGTFEAMASTGPERLPDVHAEIVEVLAWAGAAFAGSRGPIGDGGEWDYDLRGQQEWTAEETLCYDEVAQRLHVVAGPLGQPRHTLTLAISGTPEFCAALRQRFDLD